MNIYTKRNDFSDFYRKLPKIELHAHLNGSLSRSTILVLRRFYADSGIEDNTDVFNELEIGAGDPRGLSDCFQVFKIAHALTTKPEALKIAVDLTLKEFHNDGCVYIELRSTPRDTEYMSKRQYIDTVVQAMRVTDQSSIIPRFIISINRSSPLSDANEITALAIEYYKTYPGIVVGIEISGNPLVGNFKDFVPLLNQAKEAGLKVSLHCGEVCNPEEVLEMLLFKPERIGHGTCIHPKYGGTEQTWKTLCELKIPVEVCLTSNVNTRSTVDYESHHFKELYNAGIPIIICTDDKGIFSTSLPQEYTICAETLALKPDDIIKLAIESCKYIFDDNSRMTILDKVNVFVSKFFKSTEL